MTTGRAVRAMLPDGADTWPLTDHIARERQAVAVWYGKATGSWRALVTLPGHRLGRRRERLGEAANPAELRMAIAHPEGRPWPR
ncbi:hypothetical protein GCM10022214_41380 [Actinomadura miaoliensis]|uniref:Uncharacterized protein n=1 Tax=Actinomadura miaoliensis TaxID=430685 RepID=A0ABP7W1X8_9ACTN